MSFKIRAIIALILVFICANSARAFHSDLGEVDSAGFFTFPVFCLSGLGPGLDTTGDSISIYIYKSTDGDSVKSDSQTDMTPSIGTLFSAASTVANRPRYQLELETHKCIFFAQTPNPDSMFTGTYSGVVYIWSGANARTATTFNFRPVNRANGRGMQGVIVQYWAPYNDMTPTAIVEGAIPAAVAGASGGILIGGTNSGTITFNGAQPMATYTQPTGFLAATFPTTVASTTNITAGTITTTTNLTNAPTNGDLTATMKTSVQAAAAAALTAYDPPTNAELVSEIDAVQTDIATVESQTDDIGVAGAGLTALATQSSVNDLPTNSELATALASADDAVLAAVADTPTVNIGMVDGDTVPANNLKLAFDLDIDSQVVLDLRGLSIIGNHSDPYAFAFRVRNHGAGHGFHIITDTANSEGLWVQTTGASADAFKATATGAGADAIQTSASGSGSVYDWHALGSGGFRINGDMSIGGPTGLSLDNGLLSGGNSEFANIVLNNSLGVADFADDYKDMLSDSTRKALGDTLTAKLWALVYQSRPDSVIYRMMREVFRNQDTIHVDTSKLGAWFIANTTGSGGGGSSNWTDAQRDSVLRSLVWASNNSLVRLADVASLTLSGSNKNVVIYAIDTSGVDDTLPGVIISVKNSGQTANLVGGLTTNPGKITFGLMASSQYVPVPWLTGYVFPGAPLSFTTTAGAAPDTVRIYGYNFDPGTPASPSLCRVYGYLGDGPNAIRHAEVTLTLEVGTSGVVVVDTVADRTVAVRVFQTKTDANGYWYIDVIANEYLTPANTTYKYTASKAGVTLPGQEKSGLVVPTSANVRIEDLF